jgi:hypothetical protein
MPMKKLTLEIETLSVESFQVDPAVAELRGTVQGADSTDGAGCPDSYPFHCLPQFSRGCGD